jgi:hypothetical protein
MPAFLSRPRSYHRRLDVLSGDVGEAAHSTRPPEYQLKPPFERWKSRHFKLKVTTLHSLKRQGHWNVSTTSLATHGLQDAHVPDGFRFRAYGHGIQTANILLEGRLRGNPRRCLPRSHLRGVQSTAVVLLGDRQVVGRVYGKASECPGEVERVRARKRVLDQCVVAGISAGFVNSSGGTSRSSAEDIVIGTSDFEDRRFLILHNIGADCFAVERYRQIACAVFDIRTGSQATDVGRRAVVGPGVLCRRH